MSKKIRKIAIIGYSGCGKSTLAAFLAEKLGVDVLYIDTIQFAPGWIERPFDVKQKMMQEFLDAHENGWVIDGNYKKLAFDQRMDDADQIIIMTFNRVSCLRRVIRRYVENKGRSRASMTPGCDEKLDADFVKWILWKGRKSNLPMIQEVQRQYPEKVTVIHNQKELDAYYKK